MDISVATPEQVDAFEKGASTQFEARGVRKDIAEHLYANFLGKAAEDLGFAPSGDAKKVDALADKLASVIGRQHK